MKKTLAVLATAATLGATAMSAPAEARGGFGPALGFGLALASHLRELGAFQEAR